MDRIALRGIRAYGKHGANPGERDEAQPFDVDLIVELDLQAAMKSDDLAQTLDYAALHAKVVEVVTTRSYALLERLAAEILDVALSYPKIARAEVTIAKPNLLNGATPSVTIARSNARQDLP
jgi:dihydroneopterin aldolase